MSGLGVRRGRALSGRFSPPGDKSITHRALLFGLLADGVTRVRGANPGDDCARSAAAAEAMGATVTAVPGGWDVVGTAGTPRACASALDCGNSGTTLRLVAGIAAARPFVTRLVGDASLSRRPMRRIAEPLGRMGARLEGQGETLTPPLTVHGADLTGIDYVVPMASAQVATATLLAGLGASGVTRVTLPGPARDHTERMLPAFGVALERHELADGGRRVTVSGGSRLVATDVTVPGDFSGAAFLLAAAACEPGARVTALGVNLNPTRTGLLDVLAAMGATPEVVVTGESAGEPMGDVTVTGPDRLRAFDVPADWMPRMVDEAPVWAVLAAAAHGTSRLDGASELRVKESDRIATVAAGLRALGVHAVEHPAGLEVHGGSVTRGARIATHHDHRIAMAFAVLALRSPHWVTFDDLTPVATSYPGFLDTLASLGAAVEPVEAA